VRRSVSTQERESKEINADVIGRGLFFIDDSYRKAARKAMRGYTMTKLARQIAEAGYANHVIPDEIQADRHPPAGSERTCAQVIAARTAQSLGGIPRLATTPSTKGVSWRGRG
jgi:hypothetical protein